MTLSFWRYYFEVGVWGKNALELASEILSTYKDFPTLASTPVESFYSIKGISDAKALPWLPPSKSLDALLSKHLTSLCFLRRKYSSIIDFFWGKRKERCSSCFAMTSERESVKKKSFSLEMRMEFVLPPKSS